MTIRMTEISQASNQILALQNEYSSLSNLQEQAATGNKINLPSDGPADEVTIITSQAQDQVYTTDLTSISDAQSTLNQSVTTLNQVNDLLTQASTIASEGVNGGTGNITLSSLSQETSNLISQALDLANSQTNGQYLYGGIASTTAPFAVTSSNAQGLPETVTYSGSQDSGQALIGQGQTVTTVIPGNQVFQSPSGDVFNALIGLRDLLNNTGGLSSTDQAKALSAQIGVIQNAQQAVNQTISTQSNDLQNLGSLTTSIQSLQLQTKTVIQNHQSADISQLAVQLAEQQNAYQLTLSTTSNMFDPTNNLITYLTSAGL